MRGSRPLHKQSNGFKNGAKCGSSELGSPTACGFSRIKQWKKSLFYPCAYGCTDHLWSNIHNVLTGRCLHTPTFHGTLERLRISIPFSKEFLRNQSGYRKWGRVDEICLPYSSKRLR